MTTGYEELLETAEGRIALAEEHAMAHVGELIAKLLDQNYMSRKELAEKLNVTPGRITQLLDGDANMTITTLARILNAFGHLLEVSSRPMRKASVQRAAKESNKKPAPRQRQHAV